MIHRQHLAAGLLVTAEALAWFIALRAAAALVERDTLVPLAEDLERALRIGMFEDDVPVRRALDVVRGALDGSSVGPPLFVVLIAAGGAYALSRTFSRLGFPAPLRVVLGLALSIVALQVLVHVAIAGDLLVWEGEGLALLAGSGREPLSLAEFVANPDLDRVTGDAATITVAGLFIVWFRFLVAGREPVTFPQALRSFTFGFVIALIGALLAAAAAAGGVAALALPQFALAAAALAVTHAARIDERSEAGSGRRLDTPWALSLAVTLGLLVGLAGLFSLVALLELQRVLAPVVALLGAAVEGVLYVVIAPVFWVIEQVLRFVIGLLGGDVTPPEPPPVGEGGEPGEDDGITPRDLPAWLVRGGQAAVITALLWFAYRMGLLLFRRVAERRPARIEEYRERAEAAGARGLLRSLLPRRRPRRVLDGSWVRRHPAYALFARAVRGARERGLEPLPGETPIAFTQAAAGMLGATPLPAVGEAFDAARYGRREPDREALGALQRELAAWEQEHPATDEWRARIRQLRPPPVPGATGQSSAEHAFDKPGRGDGRPAEERTDEFTRRIEPPF